MSSNDEHTRIENPGRTAYDERKDVRFAAIETRVAALEVDLAVTRSSFATKDDVQRIVRMLHEHSLEFARQRADFHAGLGQQREELGAALATQKEHLTAASAEQSTRFTASLVQQKEHVTAALVEQREYFNAALAQHKTEFNAALAMQQVELQKAMMGHIWKLYGFASLLIGAVYFIARYVH